MRPEQTPQTLASYRLDNSLIVLGDQPLADAEHLDALIEAWMKSPGHAVLSRHRDTICPPSVFPRNMFEQLTSLREDAGARWLLHDADFKTIEFASRRAHVDIDTQKDLEELLDRIFD